MGVLSYLVPHPPREDGVLCFLFVVRIRTERTCLYDSQKKAQSEVALAAS